MIFDFIYQFSKTHRLIIIVAFKYFMNKILIMTKQKMKSLPLIKSVMNIMIKC